MSDYIKREDAIKQIVKGEEMYGEEFATDTGRVKDFLNVLPSADVVEGRHGKWSHDYIKDGVEYNDWFNLHCTVCGETQRDAWGKWNYCPYCGAKMDDEEQAHEKR